MLDMLVLGLLMLLQRGAEPGVLYPQILLRFGLAAGHQIASEQLAAVLLEGFAEFGDLQHAFWAVQAIAHRVVAAFGQLLLDVLMQLVAGAGLHEAGVGGVDQRAQVGGTDADGSFASRVKEQQCPTGFVQALETQHAEP